MTSEALFEHVRATLAQVEELFAKKNAAYRSERDALSNFHDAPEVRMGFMTSMQYAHSLMSKQDTQLLKVLWEGTADPEFEERAMDGIVYRILILALIKEGTARNEQKLRNHAQNYGMGPERLQALLKKGNPA